jgi:hypothetical protein
MHRFLGLLEVVAFMIAINLVAQFLLPTFTRDTIDRRVMYRLLVIGLLLAVTGLIVLVSYAQTGRF